MAGLPALQRSEPGQVRKEAATTTSCKCRGLGSPPLLLTISDGFLHTMIKKIYFILCALTLLLAKSAYPADAISIEAGYGDHTNMERLSLSHAWETRWFTDHMWSLGGYWDAGIGTWNPHAATGGNQVTTDFSITPVWRARQTKIGGLTPFVELAVGVHYLSQSRIFYDKNMSTHFQFGDHIGAGVTVGEKQDWDVMDRFQHLSNGGIQNPNPGINFLQLRVGHWF